MTWLERILATDCPGHGTPGADCRGMVDMQNARFCASRIAAAEGAPRCRRCSECNNSHHHWMDNDDAWQEGDATKACKHCDAIGDDCEACDGEGEKTSPDGYALGLCPRCEGHGVIERTAVPRP